MMPRRLARRPLWPTFLLMFLVGIGSACRNPAPGFVISDDVLYHDEFATGLTGRWQLEGDALGQTAVVDEQLLIQIDTPNVVQFATLLEPTFTDFALEVDVRQLAGDPNSSYGVLLRLQDEKQFYRFDITGSGMYVVERRNADDSWTRFLPDWTDTPAVNQGISAVNRLRVEAEGSLMRFYVNDTLLHQVSDAQYAAGRIGLDAGTFSQAGLQVAFDNLIVREQ